jgi:chloramphenicol 3-O phosphotransferase
MVGHVFPDLAVQIIVLNGGSSSGKSTLARELQELLPDLWLTFGVDSFIDALPGRGDSPRADITFRPNGDVQTAPEFSAREDLWRIGLAAMARGGAPLILDEVFLSGGATQTTMRATMEGLNVLWVGVHCDPAVAAGREAKRPDRVPGMARTQAQRVHTDMRYDIEVDTTDMSPEACACARVVAGVRHQPTAPASDTPLDDPHTERRETGRRPWLSSIANGRYLELRRRRCDARPSAESWRPLLGRRSTPLAHGGSGSRPRRTSIWS